MGGAITDFNRHALGPSPSLAFTTMSLGVLSWSFLLDSIQASLLRRASGDVGWKRFVPRCLGKSVSWSGDGRVGLSVRSPKARAQWRSLLC